MPTIRASSTRPILKIRWRATARSSSPTARATTTWGRKRSSTRAGRSITLATPMRPPRSTGRSPTTHDQAVSSSPGAARAPSARSTTRQPSPAATDPRHLTEFGDAGIGVINPAWGGFDVWGVRNRRAAPDQFVASLTASAARSYPRAEIGVYTSYNDSVQTNYYVMTGAVEAWPLAMQADARRLAALRQLRIVRRAGGRTLHHADAALLRRDGQRRPLPRLVRGAAQRRSRRRRGMYGLLKKRRSFRGRREVIFRSCFQ